jgi:hypothetical protein
MSYVIACWRWGVPHAITANKESNSFELIPLDSEVALSKIFSHPYRAGAQQILTWINNNDKDLASKELSIQTEARFRK